MLLALLMTTGSAPSRAAAQLVHGETAAITRENADPPPPGRDPPPPACPAPVLIAPVDGAVLGSRTITFSWNSISGCTFTNYDLMVRTVASMDTGGQTVLSVSSVLSGSMHTFDAQWDNIDLYWSVRASQAPAGATWAPSRRFRMTNQAKAEVISPAPGSRLSGSAVPFQWTSGIGATGYRMVAGLLPGTASYFTSGTVTATSVTVTGLPQDGSTVHVTLTTIFAGGEQSSAYQYSAAVVGTVVVLDAWTSDGGADQTVRQSEYYQGSTIRYVASLYNPNPRAEDARLLWSVTGPGGTLYTRDETVSVAAGQSLRPSAPQTLAASLAPGTYTYSLTAIHNSQSTSRTWQFTVGLMVTVDEAWTSDGGGDWNIRKSAFAPGDVIRYVVRLNNNTNAPQSVTRRWHASGPGGTILDQTFSSTISTGVQLWSYIDDLPARPLAAHFGERPREVAVLTIPRDIAAGTYTFTYTLTHSGGSMSQQATFTIGVVPCAAPTLTEPAAAAVLANHDVTFRWSALTGCAFSGYHFRVKTVAGMDAGGTTLVDVTTAATEHTHSFATSWDNQDLYWGVRAANAPPGSPWSVRSFRVVTESKASMISPTPGSRLAGVSQTFVWSPGQAAQAYLQWVGPAQGSHGYFGTLWIGDLSVTATGLPVDGSTVWVRLWTGLPSGWQYTDYQYSAALPSAVRATDAWTNDDGPDWNLHKTVFKPGDPIRYVSVVENQTGADANIEFDWKVTGSNGNVIYHYGPWAGVTPSGVRVWGLGTIVPENRPVGARGPALVRPTGAVPLSVPRDAAPGAYTFVFTVTYNGTTSTSSSTFTIEAGSVTSDDVWTSDGGNDWNVHKSVFGLGQSIRYVARIRNQSGGPVTVGFQWHVSGPGGVIFSLDEPAMAVPGGSSLQATAPQNLPANLALGLYTFAFTMTYNGTPVTRTAQFTVGSPPAKPPPPLVTPGPTSITLVWTAVSGATSYRIAYTRSSPISYQWAEVTGTMWTLLNAAPGDIWYFHLAACNGAGCSELSGAAAGTAGGTPPVPPNLRVGSTDDRSIQILWDSVSGESLLQIAWTRTSPISYQFVTVPADVTSWTHDPLPSGQSNYYHVRACNGVNCSGWSSGIGASALPFPATPSGLRLGTVTDTAIQVLWNDVANETRYLIAWTRSSPIGYQFPGLAAGVSTWTASNLVTGGIYYFHVAACAGLNCSGWSGGVVGEARTPPPVPTNLRTGLITADTIEILWDDISGETGYRVAWTAASPINYQFVNRAADITSALLTGLTANRAYHFYVQACAGLSCSNWAVLENVATRATTDWIVEVRWGPPLGDLDARLWLPTTQPSYIHYGNRGSLTAFPHAWLAQDSYAGWGPEVITITNLYSGTYTFAVYNFTGTPVLAGSSAVVKLYRGATLQRTYTVPASGVGQWWDVFRLNSSGAITDVNVLTDISPAPYQGAAAPAQKPPAAGLQAAQAPAARTGALPPFNPPLGREHVIPAPPLTPAEVVARSGRTEAALPSPPADAPLPGGRPPAGPPPR